MAPPVGKSQPCSLCRSLLPYDHDGACLSFHDDIPALQAVRAVTLGQSLKSPRMRLWDEERQQMVGFRSG